MSLILEALKKSEAKRRLGEAPDLDTPFAAKRRRRNPLPFIVAAIVIAGAAGWWLSRAPRAPNTTPAVTMQAQSAEKKPVADRIMKTADSRPPQRNVAAPPGTMVTTERPASSPFIAMPPPKATGIKNPAAPVAGTAKSAVTTPTPAVTLTTPAPAAPIQTIGVKKPELPAAMAPVAEVKTTPPASTAAKAADANNAANAKSAPATAPLAPVSPGVQPYNELPFSVRKDMPAIKLSMHVFAPEPTQRFIILNDSRMGEGDSQDELAVREIRPDGAIFEFHGKRFFFPRDGL